MVGRHEMVGLAFIGAWVLLPGAVRAQLRPSATETGVVEIGAPRLIGRAALEREMRGDSALSDHIRQYGWPDYAELQEIDVQEPFAAYEVHIYYIDRNRELVFGHVFVSPSLRDFGVLKYDGPLRSETRARLLTARPGGARATGAHG